MTDKPQTKRITLGALEWKSDDPGAFSATFATLNVIDHHGDVTVPGAFEDGKTVAIGGYQHDMMSLPVGKAVLRSDDSRAWVEGKFNLNTQIGRDTYETVKELQDVLEWSYVFTVPEWSVGDFDTDKGPVEVRFLKKIDVWSVDPVLRGAGLNTRTDHVKGYTSSTFADEAAAVLATAEEFAARASSLADVRAKDGRVLSAANVERIGSVADQLKALAASLDELLSTATPPKNDDPADPAALWAGAQHALALAHG
ncbi:Prohead protease [uncultured Caudovirales phage]|uniref:Prohead protease n=1 Tax=uncultured Caudovirales phage TaxID=2100421 RepID=A0A6J5PQU9_9CAUD|nr:Prohead protease [uncultured Caudovirales phage]CAB4173397.1 Prohead protease [uncultured Caudovirales phage]CAB4179693.1 Prohead protease [uncultured Caudovirales phage]CAB4204040.1 Prohead protease [uncultured Caudovirales phage]CAB4215908.1 Prohead protease [uncultured Caudovirales phage]